MIKNYNKIFNMHCDVHYYAQNLKLKFNLCMEKQKNKLYIGIKWTKLHNLGGKLNEVIAYEVIQTSTIIEESKLNFFLNRKGVYNTEYMLPTKSVNKNDRLCLVYGIYAREHIKLLAT